MSGPRKQQDVQLAELEERIGYAFKQRAILERVADALFQLGEPEVLLLARPAHGPALNRQT